MEQATVAYNKGTFVHNNNYFYLSGVKVVVVDAAVLLQAEWDRDLNEVWGCIIPADEVSH